MPKPCPTNRKSRAHKLLDIHSFNVPIVHYFTSISPATFSRWPDEHDMNNAGLSFKKYFPIPIERTHITEPASKSLTPHPPQIPRYTDTVSIPLRDLRATKGQLRGFKDIRSAINRLSKQSARQRAASKEEKSQDPSKSPRLSENGLRLHVCLSYGKAQ